ncbi:MAG: cation:proton antiporter [Candidatus Altiarchaeota archaeon]|nr:cation:proton antiporter [Candidatus Altiarchaeota archaeon]
MDLLLLFLIILGVAFIAPVITKKIHVPEVTGIIVFGIILGGYGLMPAIGHPEYAIVAVSRNGVPLSSVADGELKDTQLKFGGMLNELANLGLIFLMFLAGLEMDLKQVKDDLKETIMLGFMTFIVPFLSGFLLAQFFQMGFDVSLLVGVILSTTSIGVVLPVLKKLELIRTRIGSLVIGSATIDDVLSMISLAVLLKMFLSPAGDQGIVQFIIIIALFFISAFYLTPKFAELLLNRPKMMVSIEAETRFMIIVMLFIVLISEELQLHGIVGAFLAGLAFSESVKTGWFIEKINAIGYGFFIPIFFFMVGAKTDLGVLFLLQDKLIFTIFLIIVAILSKFVGAFIVGKLIGLGNKETIGISFAMITRLAVGLAAANVALENGLIDTSIFSSFVLLATLTTLMTPPLTRMFLHREDKIEGVMFRGNEK